MFARSLVFAFFCTALVPAAFAQRGGLSGPRGQDEVDTSGRGLSVPNQPFTQNKLDRISDILHLNKEQKNGAREIFDAAQKEAAPLRDEIQKTRVAIASAILIQKSQQEQDQLLANYANLMAQMTGIELRAFAKLVGSLKEDQQKRSGPVFQMMAGMFSTRNWNTGQ